MHCHGDAYVCSRCGEAHFVVRFTYDRLYRGFKVKAAWCDACGKAPEGRGQWQQEPRQVTEWERLGINRRTWFRRLARERAKAIGERAE